METIVVEHQNKVSVLTDELGVMVIEHDSDGDDLQDVCVSVRPHGIRQLIAALEEAAREFGV